MLPAAWISLTLAFAPRHRDVPVAQFVVPALAMSLCFLGRVRRSGEHREEAALTAVILGCSVAQLEAFNPESSAWLVIGALISAPWLGSLGAELARIGRLLANARQAQQGQNHT